MVPKRFTDLPQILFSSTSPLEMTKFAGPGKMAEYLKQLTVFLEGVKPILCCGGVCVKLHGEADWSWKPRELPDQIGAAD